MKWRSVTLLRKDADNIHCVIHDEVEDWYLVEEITDFHFDGYALISKSSVECCRYNKFDKTFEKMLRQFDRRPTAPPEIIIDSGEDFFTALSRLETFVTVESEDESRFMIGEIHKVTNNRLFMKHFTAAGEWFKRSAGIDYTEIGRACFMDEYGTSWYKYLNSKNG